MGKLKKSVLLSLIGAMIIWSMSFIWSKMAFEVFSPVSTVFLRLIISTILIFGYLYFSKQFQKIKSKDYKWFLLLGFFEPFLYFLGESFGLKLVTSTVAAVIIAIIPIFTAVLGVLVFKERISLINILGIIFSFFGVAFMVMDRTLSLNAPLLGILLLGLAVFSASIYALLLKHLAHTYSGYSIVAYQNIVGIFLFFPLFVTNDWDTLARTEITFKALSAVVLLAIFASTIAFILYTHGIKHIGVTKASAFTNLVPILTALFAWLFLSELIGWQQIIGIAIVIGGLFASQFKKQLNDDVRPYEV